MKIVLFGRDGQVGSALAPGLAGLGDMHAFDRDDVDFRDPRALRNLLDETRPGLVVNAAAMTDVEGAEAAREAAFQINATAPGAIAAWAAQHGAALVHYSTDYVYDGSGTRPWTEDDPTGPRNVYGESKLAGDEAVAASGAVHLILRTSWVYAARGRNFLSTMLRLGAEREELSVVADQVGAPTSAATIAEATLTILAQAGDVPVPFLRDKGGVVHVACAGETSWHGFAQAIFARARARGRELRVQRVGAIDTKDYPTAAVRPLNSRLSCARLRARFGIVPVAWEAALDRAFDELA